MFETWWLVAANVSARPTGIVGGNAPRATTPRQRLPELATDLVRANVDAIVAQSNFGASAAAKATATIPIVFVTLGDPLEEGLVASLARPGGNLTGFSLA